MKQKLNNKKIFKLKKLKIECNINWRLDFR